MAELGEGGCGANELVGEEEGGVVEDFPEGEVGDVFCGALLERGDAEGFS